MSNKIASVIRRAWMQPFKTKSNFSREFANEIAVAASLGLLTTKVGKTSFGREWRVTRKGMDFIGE